MCTSPSRWASRRGLLGGSAPTYEAEAHLALSCGTKLDHCVVDAVHRAEGVSENWKVENLCVTADEQDYIGLLRSWSLHMLCCVLDVLMDAAIHLRVLCGMMGSFFRRMFMSFSCAWCLCLFSEMVLNFFSDKIKDVGLRC